MTGSETLESLHPQHQAGTPLELKKNKNKKTHHHNCFRRLKEKMKTDFLQKNF